jgi:hypothetical protein
MNKYQKLKSRKKYPVLNKIISFSIFIPFDITQNFNLSLMNDILVAIIQF